MVEGRGTFKILTGNPTGKRRWEENITSRIDFEEIGSKGGN